MNSHIDADTTHLGYKKYLSVLKDVHDYGWDGWGYGWRPSTKTQRDAASKLFKANMIERIEKQHSDQFGTINVVGYIMTSKGFNFYYSHIEAAAE